MHLSELVDMRTGCTVYDQFSYMYFWWSWWSLQAKTHWSKNEVVLHTTSVAEATSASSAVFGSASSVIPRQIPLKLHATGLYAKVTVKAVRPLYHGHEACSSRSRWQCCCWAQNLLCVLCVTDCKTSQEERGETVTTTWKNHFSFWGPSCCCLWHALVVTFICTKTAETVSQWLICPNRTKISRPSVLKQCTCREVGEDISGLNRYLLKLQFDGWCEMGWYPLGRLSPDIHGLFYCCNSELYHDRVRVSINYLNRTTKHITCQVFLIHQIIKE